MSIGNQLRKQQEMDAGGKAFLILCILLSIPSEALVVSDTLKPPQTLHIVRHIIGTFTFFFIFIKPTSILERR